jgi:hypothetical protein
MAVEGEGHINGFGIHSRVEQTRFSDGLDVSKKNRVKESLGLGVWLGG